MTTKHYFLALAVGAIAGYFLGSTLSTVAPWSTVANALTGGSNTVVGS